MAAKIPDVLDKARLLVIVALNTETLQLLHVVSPHDAEEYPTPMYDHT
jgi:hypothetical protein